MPPNKHKDFLFRAIMQPQWYPKDVPLAAYSLNPETMAGQIPTCQ